MSDEDRAAFEKFFAELKAGLDEFQAEFDAKCTRIEQIMADWRKELEQMRRTYGDDDDGP